MSSSQSNQINKSSTPATANLGQPTLFDSGRERRDAALGRLSATRYARDGLAVAAGIAFSKGWVTADDVRAVLGDPPSQGPMGAIFKAGGYFYRLSNTHTKVPQGNARVIGKWALTATGRRDLRYLDPNP